MNIRSMALTLALCLAAGPGLAQDRTTPGPLKLPVKPATKDLSGVPALPPLQDPWFSWTFLSKHTSFDSGALVQTEYGYAIVAVGATGELSVAPFDAADMRPIQRQAWQPIDNIAYIKLTTPPVCRDAGFMKQIQPGGGKPISKDYGPRLYCMASDKTGLKLISLPYSRDEFTMRVTYRTGNKAPEALPVPAGSQAFFIKKPYGSQSKPGTDEIAHWHVPLGISTKTGTVLAKGLSGPEDEAATAFSSSLPSLPLPAPASCDKMDATWTCAYVDPTDGLVHMAQLVEGNVTTFNEVAKSPQPKEPLTGEIALIVDEERMATIAARGKSGRLHAIWYRFKHAGSNTATAEFTQNWVDREGFIPAGQAISCVAINETAVCLTTDEYGKFYSLAF